MTVISQILTTPGVDFVGPLPAEVQSNVTFVAAVGAESNVKAAANELIEFLREPRAIAVIRPRVWSGVSKARHQFVYCLVAASVDAFPVEHETAVRRACICQVPPPTGSRDPLHIIKLLA
jgi:hypothetical protein